MVDTSKFYKLSEMKRILIGFAAKIDIINMNNIPMQKTIELIKNKNDLQGKIVSFIKNADLYLENFEYAEMGNIKIDVSRNEKYRKGALGALPDPELIHSLLDMKGNKEGGSADEE